MRNWSAVALALCCACGSPGKTTDGAVSNSPADGNPGISFIDADPCGHWAVTDFVTDAASCAPVPWDGYVYDLGHGADGGSCEGGGAMLCDEACGPGPALYSQVSKLLGRCLTGESTFIVTFSQGCADRFYLRTPYYRPDEIAACVAQALSLTRFPCAEQVPCWQWSESTLATP